MTRPKQAISKVRCILALCWLAFGVAHGQHNDLKASSKVKPPVIRPASGHTLALEAVLANLEITRNVSFAYQKKYVEGKSLKNAPILTHDLEAYLKEVLTPLGLDFKRIKNVNEAIYVIYPAGKEKTRTVKTDSTNAAGKTDKDLFFASGSVVDEKNNGLPWVNVVVKNTPIGTVTDEHGNFSLQLPDHTAHSLVFSYIGYASREIVANGFIPVQVVLTETSSPLSEIVVTALGINRKQRSLGYAANTVAGEEITAAGNTNFVSALYGKVPGMRVRTAPGGATSAVTVQLRGINSLNYNTQPLYVIDGVMMRDANEKGAAGINNSDYYTDVRIRGNGILDINPSDIESLTVLKGASATALYGSDAASGVIVITTKKGQPKSGLGVDLNVDYSIEQVAFTPRYQNVYGPGYDRAKNISLGATPEGWVPVDSDGDRIIDGQRPLFESPAQFGPRLEGQEVWWWDGSRRPYAPHPDNYKDFYRIGSSAHFNMALHNQIDKFAYRFSYSRNNYEGIQVGGKQERNTFNLNSSFALNPRLEAGLVVNYINSFVHNRPTKVARVLGSFNGFFGRAEDMSVFYNKYQTSEGYKWVPPDQALRNPDEALKFTTPRGFEVMDLLWRQLRNSEDETQNRLITSFTLNYNIAKGLSLRSRLGYDFTNLNIEARHHNEYPTIYNGQNSTGAYNVTEGRYAIFYSDLLLTYTREVTKDLTASFKTGWQLKDEKYEDRYVSTNGGLVVENLFSLDNSFNPVLINDQSDAAILKYAFLGLLNLQYKNFLFFEGTARQEYSSTLPPANNRYFYPSANTSFVFSEVVHLPRMFSLGKLRASYGIVGNAPPVHESNILYELKNLQTPGGAVVSAKPNGQLYGNNNIKPERKHEMEFGLETGMFQNRLGVDLTYYNNVTHDQILKLDVPTSTGAARTLTNVGELRSHGWEAGIHAVPTAGFVEWHTDVNIAYSTTRVKDLAPGLNQLIFADYEGSSIRVVAEKGQQIGNIYAYPRKTDSQGNFVINKDGLYIIDKTRYVKAGNLLPKFIGGFSNTLYCKNFSLRFVMDYSYGSKIISTPLKYGMSSGLYENTLQYRDAAHGGLAYYIDDTGTKVLMPNGDAEFHDGVILKGVTEEGTVNTKIVDAATYYSETFAWGNNAWNEAGAIYRNDYIKFRELTLGYTLPKVLTDKLHFQSIRCSLTGRNLFYVWRSLQNADPESAIGSSWINQGVDTGSNAATRSYGFAINLSF